MTDFISCATLTLRLRKAVTKRVHIIEALQRTFRISTGIGEEAYTSFVSMSMLRGMKSEVWKMASEQRTEP